MPNYTQEQLDNLIDSIIEKIKSLPDSDLTFSASYVREFVPFTMRQTYKEWMDKIQNPNPIEIEIPIILKEGSGVIAVDLVISYNSQELTLTDVVKGIDTEENQPAPVSNLKSMSKARICYFRITPLESGEKEIIVLKGLSKVRNPNIIFDKILINEMDKTIEQPGPLYLKWHPQDE